ncbi:MAG: adenylosuccinate lyase [Actinomycetota bacterium]|nr:adenylosuccinate lyase [Actinomycetota bacterium]
MIDRYSTDEMSEVWSDVCRYERWLEVELLATEAQAGIGVVPAADAARCRASAPRVDERFVVDVVDREAITNHDVAAFVDVVQQRIGEPAGSWIHYGLTSSDVVDTALAWAMRDTVNLVVEAAGELFETLVELALRHRDTVMVGRTHGIHAEPITFGAKVALWALQLARDLDRLATARRTVGVCKLSGAVGTYSNIDPRVEAHVGAALGLTPVPATQVLARDRHAELLWVLASVGATVEVMAVELRHLQRTEVAEVREGFAPGQKGSSAMPHKRNPISAETMTGLARVLRSNLMAGMQDVALWHERDISHSSVERIVIPDSSQLAHYVLSRMTRLLTNLEVDAERMRQNLESSHGLVFSQPVLLALVAAGMTRDDAYRVVQRAAAQSWDRAQPFRALLDEDPDVREAGIDRDELNAAFDLQRSLGRVDLVFEELERIASGVRKVVSRNG